MATNHASMRQSSRIPVSKPIDYINVAALFIVIVITFYLIHFYYVPKTTIPDAECLLT